MANAACSALSEHPFGRLGDEEDVVRIIVGPPDAETEFAVKRDLILRSPELTLFNRAFHNAPNEGILGRVRLPGERPQVFKAFYDWLTTSRVGPSLLYTGGGMLAPNFWFEACKMADRLMLEYGGQEGDHAAPCESFMDLVFKRFRYIFMHDLERIPDADLVRDIFENEPYGRPGVKPFQKHLIYHATYQLQGRSGPKLTAWTYALEAHPRFGASVAVRLAAVASIPDPVRYQPALQVHFGPPGVGQCAFVNLSDTISSLRQKLPVLRQNIYYNGIRLHDDCRLSDHDIEHESRLTLSAQETSLGKTCSGHHPHRYCMF